ncbi:hypothetical protein [Kribbella sp. C-35]|uniref:hypothetical protein n=1 Tax=Kribbella sp. C-35 TaxID=2789276 RepID=UPI00397C951E
MGTYPRRMQLAINQVDELTPSTWPSPDVPMQMHLDYAVPSVDEPLFVLADPAGHPFCLLVGEP